MMTTVSPVGTDMGVSSLGSGGGTSAACWSGGTVASVMLGGDVSGAVDGDDSDCDGSGGSGDTDGMLTVVTGAAVVGALVLGLVVGTVVGEGASVVVTSVGDAAGREGVSAWAVLNPANATTLAARPATGRITLRRSICACSALASVREQLSRVAIRVSMSCGSAPSAALSAATSVARRSALGLVPNVIRVN